MKKQYDAPVAEKVDFDYEENVTASGVPTNQATKCYNPCGWRENVAFFHSNANNRIRYSLQHESAPNASYVADGNVQIPANQVWRTHGDNIDVYGYRACFGGVSK